MTTPEVQNLNHSGYQPQVYYHNNPTLKAAIDELRTGFCGVHFEDIANSLLNSDPYMLLADYADYEKIQRRASEIYRDQKAWNRMALCNIALAGRFAADRAIHEYARNIWGAEPVK